MIEDEFVTAFSNHNIIFGKADILYFQLIRYEEMMLKEGKP